MSKKNQSTPEVTRESNARARVDSVEPGVASEEAAAVWVPRESLHVWKENPRKNDGPPVDKVAASIRRFGWGAPIIARRNGEIIAGHTRWKAAGKLGLERVPVRYLDLDPAEAHILAIADNKLGELADWDDDLLRAVLGDLEAQGANLDLGTGLSEKEIAALLKGAEDDVGAEPELGDSLKYSVVVECTDERAQAMLLERLDGEGFKCKPLIA